ncbi:MAG: tripartite tricarboxylate transporter TctB family protein [Rhizobiaceae bacterium]
MRSLDRDTIVSILLLLFCGFLIWAGRLIRDPQFGELSPAAWPQAVTYVLTGFCLIFFFQNVMRLRSTQPADMSPTDIERPEGLIGWLKYFGNPIACFALYFIFLMTLPFFGTLIGGSLLVFALLSLLGGIEPRQMALHAVIAVISVGAMWSIFTFGLRVLLPRGEIMPGI